MNVRLKTAALLLALSPLASAQTVIGITADNTLVRFSANAPGTVVATTPVSGLPAASEIVGIDARPATGALYALTDSGALYVIDPASGTASLSAQLDVALSGTFFGVDFNPVPDRLRVVSDSGQNLRINVDTGATIVDGAINPAGPMVGASAYINSVAGAMSTALYNIDVASGNLLLQSPPNDGTVVVQGPLTVVPDADGAAAMDVLTSDGTDRAFAAMRVAGTTGFYEIDLAGGAATLIGNVGGNPTLRGIALIDSVGPSMVPAQATAVGLASGNSLLRFPVGAPGAVAANVPVAGLQGGDTLVGIDFRPATGELYGLASSGRLYLIDPVGGAATLASTLDVALSGTFFGVDFNPVPDRLRVVSNSGQNLRINVDTGATIVDGAINPPGPQIAAGAYTNSLPGATSTALYDVDSPSGTLFLQSPPNDGTLVAIGPLGFSVTSSSGFDILTTPGGNAAFGVFSVGASTGLYSVDLASGEASLIGAIEGNPQLLGLAVSPTAIGGGPAPVRGPNVVPVDAPIALGVLLLAILASAGAMLRRLH